MTDLDHVELLGTVRVTSDMLVDGFRQVGHLLDGGVGHGEDYVHHEPVSISYWQHYRVHHDQYSGPVQRVNYEGEVVDQVLSGTFYRNSDLSPG